MKTKILKRFEQQINQFNTCEYKALKTIIKNFDDKKMVANLLETSYEKVVCPHCGEDKYYKWGRQNDLQRYKCKECNRTFNCLSKTPLARLRKKGRWLNYSKCLAEGLTVRYSGELCGVSKTTSFRWRHRFLVGSNEYKTTELNGIVETIDFTIPKNYKGSRNIPKPFRHKKGEDKLSGIYDNVSILFSRDRNRNMYDSVVEKLSVNSLRDNLKYILAKDSLFCSINSNLYRDFIKISKRRHGYIDIEKGEYVKKDIVHINNVIRYSRGLFIWMIRFRGVATKYLFNYLSWFRDLEEFDMNIPSKDILIRAMTITNKLQLLTQT